MKYESNETHPQTIFNSSGFITWVDLFGGCKILKQYAPMRCGGVRNNTRQILTNAYFKPIQKKSGFFVYRINLIPYIYTRLVSIIRFLGLEAINLF